MKKPEFIIFDYGGTLAYEVDWDDAAGERAALRYAVSNPLSSTAEEIVAERENTFRDIERIHDELGFDVPVRTTDRLVYGRLGITFSLSPEEIEIERMNAINRAVPVSGAAETLRFLRGRGIKTAVLSNNGWSGDTLRARLEALFPDHAFEFVLCSADYFISKPDPRLFDIAVMRAGVDRSGIWFCGNDLEADAVGAAAAGLFPVLLAEDGSAPREETCGDAAFLRIGSLTDLCGAV